MKILKLVSILLAPAALDGFCADTNFVTATKAVWYAPPHPSVRDAASSAASDAHLDYPPGQPPRFWSIAAAETVMARWPDFSRAYFNGWTYVNGYELFGFEMLYRATGDRKYADKAAELARIILDSQERRIPDWTVPLTGFFYTSPAKDRILHYCHRGREQELILALTALANELPNHPDWMKWYSAVALHSQYLKTIAEYTEPYTVLPASIYTGDDYLQVPANRREAFRQQVLNGIPLGAGHYLRLFPVWLDYRGHFGTILPQALALAGAAQLRGDLEAAQLSERQLEWVAGRNPFAQSTMYGEGYDFAPQYTPSSGNMVGSLPVGIQTRRAILADSGDMDVQRSLGPSRGLLDMAYGDTERPGSGRRKGRRCSRV